MDLESELLLEDEFPVAVAGPASCFSPFTAVKRDVGESAVTELAESSIMPTPEPSWACLLWSLDAGLLSRTGTFLVTLTISRFNIGSTGKPKGCPF